MLCFGGFDAPLAFSRERNGYGSIRGVTESPCRLAPAGSSQFPVESNPTATELTGDGNRYLCVNLRNAWIRQRYPRIDGFPGVSSKTLRPFFWRCGLSVTRTNAGAVRRGNSPGAPPAILNRLTACAPASIRRASRRPCSIAPIEHGCSRLSPTLLPRLEGRP